MLGLTLGNVEGLNEGVTVGTDAKRRLFDEFDLLVPGII